jgi:hypothetical protein
VKCAHLQGIRAGAVAFILLLAIFGLFGLAQMFWGK